MADSELRGRATMLLLEIKWAVMGEHSCVRASDWVVEVFCRGMTSFSNKLFNLTS